MSGRTTTSSLDSISLKLPAGPVTFSFPSSPLAKQYTKANHSFISIPPKSPWCPGAHWHEAYTEHIKVVKGRAKVTIDGKSRLVGPEDGMMTFEKLQIHDFERADKVGKRGEDWEAEDVVIEEWTDPEDGFKEVFFYNVMSIFLDQSNGKIGLLSTIIQLLTTIQYVDNYVAILPTWIPFAVNHWMCHSLYTIGRTLGWACGYKTWYEEYTPQEYWDVARRGGEGGRKTL